MEEIAVTTTGKRGRGRPRKSSVSTPQDAAGEPGQGPPGKTTVSSSKKTTSQRGSPRKVNVTSPTRRDQGKKAVHRGNFDYDVKLMLTKTKTMALLLYSPEEQYPVPYWTQRSDISKKAWEWLDREYRKRKAIVASAKKIEKEEARLWKLVTNRSPPPGNKIITTKSSGSRRPKGMPYLTPEVEFLSNTEPPSDRPAPVTAVSEPSKKRRKRRANNAPAATKKRRRVIKAPATAAANMTIEKSEVPPVSETIEEIPNTGESYGNFDADNEKADNSDQAGQDVEVQQTTGSNMVPTPEIRENLQSNSEEEVQELEPGNIVEIHVTASDMTEKETQEVNEETPEIEAENENGTDENALNQPESEQQVEIVDMEDPMSICVVCNNIPCDCIKIEYEFWDFDADGKYVRAQMDPFC